jgi:sigma-E factor negative regulatory protein RseC
MPHIESEIGKVLETSAGRARVEVSPSGMCSHCDMASTCIPASSGNRIIEVADPIGVAPGLSVRIELASGKLLLASFLAYVFPLIFLFAGALLGFSATSESSGELGGGLGSLVGLAAGLLLSRMYAQRLAARGKINPVITGIVDEEDQEGA